MTLRLCLWLASSEDLAPWLLLGVYWMFSVYIIVHSWCDVITCVMVASWFVVVRAMTCGWSASIPPHQSGRLNFVFLNSSSHLERENSGNQPKSLPTQERIWKRLQGVWCKPRTFSRIWATTQEPSPLKIAATYAGETSGRRSISRPRFLSPKSKH